MTRLAAASIASRPMVAGESRTWRRCSTSRQNSQLSTPKPTRQRRIRSTQLWRATSSTLPCVKCAVVLGKEAGSIFEYRYGIEADGNVPSSQDIEGWLKGKNVLYQSHSFSGLGEAVWKERRPDKPDIERCETEASDPTLCAASAASRHKDHRFLERLDDLCFGQSQQGSRRTEISRGCQPH